MKPTDFFATLCSIAVITLLLMIAGSAAILLAKYYIWVWNSF